MKNYKQSPLPFQGQKRNFVTAFKEQLKSFKSDATYVDLFGGSGLLAHTVKRAYPNANVVYNDFDGFARRLQAIPETNLLLAEFRAILVGIERKARVPIGLGSLVDNAIYKHYKKYGYVDCITISANILFSGKYKTTYKDFKNNEMYNRVRMTPIPEASDYLDDLIIDKADYRVLFEKYKNDKNVVFLVDPPYLSTDVSSYSSSAYWKLKDYLSILEILQNRSYFYFTSNKSSIVELMQWFQTTTLVGSPFATANYHYVSNAVSHQSKYQDIMISNKNSDE